MLLFCRFLCFSLSFFCEMFHVKHFYSFYYKLNRSLNVQIGNLFISSFGLIYIVLLKRHFFYTMNNTLFRIDFNARKKIFCSIRRKKRYNLFLHIIKETIDKEIIFIAPVCEKQDVKFDSYSFPRNILIYAFYSLLSMVQK